MPRHEITVYPFAGRQLFFRIPDSWCEECDVTLRLVNDVATEIGDIDVRIKPWFNHLFDALKRGGWHAPVVTIDGKVFSQGVVPDEAKLRLALAGSVSS